MATGFIMLDAPNTTTAQGGYPRRGGFRPSGTCIVHTSEGAWQAGVDSLTRLVRTRSDYGCYHQACDWADIARYYPWEWECWQDSETNNWAVGIAAACKTSDWSAMPEEIREGYYRNMARMAADFVVYMRDTYGVVVPLRRISGAEARAGVPGFCAHGDSGIARSDPGRDFDWSRFFDYIRQALGVAGGLNYSGAIVPEAKEEGPFMALTDQQQDDIYWILCTQEGRAALAQMIASESASRTLNAEIPRGGAAADWGNTSLAGLVAWNDANVLQIVGAVAAAAASDGSSVEEIKAAVVAALESSVVKVDVSVAGGADHGAA